MFADNMNVVFTHLYEKLYENVYFILSIRVICCTKLTHRVHYGHVGNKNFAIGNINNNINTVFDYDYNCFDRLLQDKCRNCIYLPLCYGGCILEKQTSDNNNGCEKEYYIKNMTHLIKSYEKELPDCLPLFSFSME